MGSNSSFNKNDARENRPLALYETLPPKAYSSLFKRRHPNSARVVPEKNREINYKPFISDLRLTTTNYYVLIIIYQRLVRKTPVSYLTV